MLTYIQFLKEGKENSLSGRVMKTSGKQQMSVDHTDDSLEKLRRRLLDIYYRDVDDSDKRDIINRCLSTYVYSLDKNLKISSDIIEKLSKATGKPTEDLIKTLQKETDDHFKEPNHYGKTS